MRKLIRQRMHACMQAKGVDVPEAKPHCACLPLRKVVTAYTPIEDGVRTCSRRWDAGRPGFVTTQANGTNALEIGRQAMMADANACTVGAVPHFTSQPV